LTGEEKSRFIELLAFALLTGFGFLALCLAENMKEKPPEEAVEPGRNAVFSRVGAEVMESGSSRVLHG
jgi:hypothetical protein